MSDNIEVLARRRLSLVQQKADIEEAIKSIDAQLVDAIEVGGVVEIDGAPAFEVRQKRIFSVDLAREHVPEQLLDAATVPTLDAKVLKSLLPPALVDRCMKPGAIYVQSKSAGSR